MRTLIFAALLPMAGCFLINPCGNAKCPSPDPVGDSLWEITETSREDVVDGVLEVAGDTVIVEYTDDLGQTWEVEYAVVDRFPVE